MKLQFTFFCLTLCLFFGLNSFTQNTLQTGLPNPDFTRYMQEKNAGTLKNTTTDGYFLGEIPTPVKRNFSSYVSTKAAISDPIYDLRTAGPGGTSLLTSVKNQGSCGSCWTFAAMGSVEARWKTLGLGTYDLSENNMNNCHEFVFLSCEGGNIDMAASYFARKSGPISEADDPYVAAAGTCPSGLNDVAYVHDVRFLPSTPNDIKQALVDYGALYTNMRWEDISYNNSNKTYYYNGSEGSNHAVLLVGWDDTKTTAGGTGAWIIKNSWGASWGESGYFYISYNDTKVNTQVGYFPDKTDFDAKAKIYSYSRLGHINNCGYGNNTGYGLIKYVATGDQRITKIGTWVSDAGTTVEVKIYDDFNGSTLSNQLGSISDKVCNLPGYYSFDFSNPVSISSGNDFFILVKYFLSGATYTIPYEKAYSGYAAPTIETGKCWVSPNGTGSFSAIGGSTSNLWDLCINAYGVQGPSNPANFTAMASGSSQVNLDWDLNPNNDEVIVAFNTENTFGTPVDGNSYSVNDAIAGGGTIIYSGSATSFSHNSLNHSTTYYYKIWSADDNNSYSGGANAYATTSCLPVTVFSTMEDFAAVTSCPTCWQLIDHESNGQVWQFGNYSCPYETLNFTPNFAYLNSDGYGDGYTQNADLISPSYDFSGYTGITLSFKHFFREYSSSDLATLSYSLNNGVSWTQLQQWNSVTSNPATYNQTISALSNQAQVKFQWNYIGSYGYYWIVDEISVSATASSSLIVSNETHTVSSNMAYQNVTVEGDGKLSVDEDKILTVTGDFTIQSDATGTGSFIQNGFLNVAGDIIVQKYLPATTTSGWTLSVPVVSANESVFTGADGIYFYNSSTPGWQLHTSGALNQMTGYVVRFPATETVEFNGALNNNSFSRTNLIRTTNPDNYGWNYVGNPYPSPIDWDLVVGADNQQFVNNYHINAAIYIRKHDGGVLSYIPNMTVGNPDRIIPSMQAFWVQVAQGQTTGTLDITNDARVHGSNDTYKATASDILKLSLDRDGFSDETVICFREHATNYFDGAYDAFKMGSLNMEHPQIYTLDANNEELAINTMPELTSDRVIHLGFKTHLAGSFILNTNEINAFNNNVCVILEDLYENTLTDLRQQDKYNFIALEGTCNNRFLLHFNPSTSEIVGDKSLQNPIEIYTYDKTIYISNITDKNATLHIYNVLGQEVMNQQLVPNTLNKVNTNLATGQYIVKVMGHAKVASQKVYIK